jgi:hypothetical protein
MKGHVLTDNPYHTFPSAHAGKWRDLKTKQGPNMRKKGGGTGTYPKHCPSCKHPVRPPRTEAALYPGTKVMTRSDGTCYACWLAERGGRDRNHVPTVERPHHSDPARQAELEAIRDQNTLDGYQHWRQRRIRRVFAQPLVTIGTARKMWEFQTAHIEPPAVSEVP